ncbi:DUF2087 domain-containing protein [Microbacterium sp. NE2HP2]|uniref:DUF2087 domain-containing protein n=1 Tax=Microbacterium plantarum TaxID=1816425 RepID=UPI002365F74F|nr:DUF2087 domain-containing protein [Microbacterium plantarum]MDD7944731.1 DUF2087 domain-containing protein [Microbacterium plantarum]
MSDSSLRPVRSLVMMLRSPRLRVAFADLIGPTPSASVDGESEAFVRSGVAERADDGVRLSESFLDDALAALDAQLGALAVLQGPRISAVDLALDELDPAVAAVARRVVSAGEQVTEPALNERLSMFVTDAAFFRRHAVDTGVLERTADGAVYWLADRGK